MRGSRWTEKAIAVRDVFREEPWAAFLPKYAPFTAILDAEGYPISKDGGGVPRLLHSGQAKFAASRAVERYLIGANRGGKSFIGALETAWFAHGFHPSREIPENNELQWCGFPDWKNHGTPLTVPLLRWALGPTAVYKKNDGVFLVTSKRSGDTVRVVLKSYDSGPAKWQGQAPGRVWLDEAPKYDIYEEVISRVGEGDLEIDMTLTPLYDAGWLFADIYEPWIDAGCPERRAFFGVGIDENPHLNKEQVEEMKQSLRNNPEMYQIRVLGDWSSISGRVYKMLDAKVHLVDDFEIPGVHRPTRKGEEPWTLYRAIDLGLRSPAVILWVAIDPRGLGWVYREQYVTNIPIPELCRMALAQELPLERGRFVRTVMDPAGFIRDPVDGKALIDHYVKNGIYASAGNNSRQYGFDKMIEAFHYEKDEDGVLVHPPKYRIFRSCTNTWREHRKAAWAPKKANSPVEARDDVQKKNDHTVDALRYLEATGSGPEFVPWSEPWEQEEDPHWDPNDEKTGNYTGYY